MVGQTFIIPNTQYDVPVKNVKFPTWVKATIFAAFILVIVIIIPALVATKGTSDSSSNAPKDTGWFYTATYNDSTCIHALSSKAYITDLCEQLFLPNGNVYNPSTFIEYKGDDTATLVSGLYSNSSCAGLPKNATTIVNAQSTCTKKTDGSNLWVKSWYTPTNKYSSPIEGDYWINSYFSDSGCDHMVSQANYKINQCIPLTKSTSIKLTGPAKNTNNQIYVSQTYYPNSKICLGNPTPTQIVNRCSPYQPFVGTVAPSTIATPYVLFVSN